MKHYESGESKTEDTINFTSSRLKTIYEQVLREAVIWSVSTVIATVLGVLLIITGILLVFFLENKTIVIVTSLAGIISGIVAVVFLKATRGVYEESHKILQSLESTRRYSEAVRVATEVTNEEDRDRIIKQVLKELHATEDRNSRSSHENDSSLKGSLLNNSG